jgi:ribosomal protein S25
MANENTNPLFAYAEARIAAWQAVLASLKSALALDPGGQTFEGLDLSSVAASQNGEAGQPIDLPEGAFLGKSVPVCIKLYLSAARKKKTVKEIAAALREGGVESKSENFENNVTSALARLKAAGEILRFKDGWGLSEWYPVHIRGAAPSAVRRIPKKGKKLARKNTARKSPTASDRIIELLRTKPEREYSPEEIAQHIGVGVQVARLILGTLRKSGKVKISAPGMYAIGRPLLVASRD